MFETEGVGMSAEVWDFGGISIGMSFLVTQNASRAYERLFSLHGNEIDDAMFAFDA